jgi:acyl-CoA reductase-like NAD-dependent aldehyde dehydrogenase
VAERAESATLRTDFSLLVDGELIGSERQLDVIDPARGIVFARCPAAGRAELERAVAAARRAFLDWRHRSFEERAALVAELSKRLRARQN